MKTAALIRSLFTQLIANVVQQIPAGQSLAILAQFEEDSDMVRDNFESLQVTREDVSIVRDDIDETCSLADFCIDSNPIDVVRLYLAITSEIASELHNLEETPDAVTDISAEVEFMRACMSARIRKAGDVNLQECRGDSIYEVNIAQQKATTRFDGDTRTVDLDKFLDNSTFAGLAGIYQAALYVTKGA